MRLTEIQSRVKNWNDHNFPRKLPHQPLLGIGEEAGELMHAHLKAEQGIRGTAAEHRAAKIDAVGDIVIYLADYCNQAEIDLAVAVAEVLGEVEKRDWIRFPKNGITE